MVLNMSIQAQRKQHLKTFGQDQIMSVLIQTSLLRRLYLTILCNLFAVVADGTNTDRATALADIFANASMASVNNGNTNTGQSTDMLDISTAATTATLDVRIVGLYEDEGNTDYSAVGHQYIVRLLGHFNSGSAAAVNTADNAGIYENRVWLYQEHN